MGTEGKPFTSRILPIIGFALGLLTFLAWPFTFALIYYGSNIVRTVIFILLIYQYAFARRSETYRRFLLWLGGVNYFDKVELIIEDGQFKDEKSLICHHPHGILSFGFAMSVALNEKLFKVFHVASRFMLNLPLSGIFARWLGLVGADNRTFKDTMKKGKNIRFVPGGFEEATITNSTKDRVYIKERKGFIKYALEYGYTLYPSYTFNENKIYNTINVFEGLRLFLNKFKIPGTIFYGKYGPMPRTDVEIITVIGKGFELPLIEHPTNEQVDQYHQMYVRELVALYDRYKKIYGGSDELEIL